MRWLLTVCLLLTSSLACFGQSYGDRHDARILPWRRKIEERLRRLEQNQRSPQQQPPIIIVPPYQQLPIPGDPKQQLPIPGEPKQPLPIPGDPRQPMPIPGDPKQQLPPQGTPRQQLPLTPGPSNPQIGQGPQVLPIDHWGQPQQYSGQRYTLYRPRR